MNLTNCYVEFKNVQIIHGIDDYVSFKSDGRQTKCLIRYTTSDRAYFKHKGARYYFDELMKC